ncbi:mannose-1-phosphate guanyltransferase [Gloeobacter morelensis]|uniref:Mannose-1-phosphate guanyltransferase n=1 Tax=Gloeobacter morelensis MG652769 TaxID=2781736 RepID=A0ABY3PH98_9CYAN|nr:mannose-1-phosphate guanyltransferase [Gloeobacter morelensis]UFP93043.1 mannose-1-phosphate guanyltransferase [Gloeobacter morelensis MG652769]
MRAVLMAGGSGTRLRPLTCDLPKPMVPILNRPISEHILNLLKRHGVDEVIATLYYLPDVMREYFRDGSDFGLRMTYAVEEEKPLGTAGCVKNIENLLHETFIVISGDSLTDIDLSAAVAFHKEHGSKATLVLARVPDPMEFGVVITDAHGRIVRFLEKPSTSEVFSDTVNTGTYILEPEVLEYLPADTEVDFSKDLFPKLLAKGEPMYGYVAEGYWCDVGSLDTYREAQYDALAGKIRLEHGYRQHAEGIWIGDNTIVDPSVHLEAPLIIGHNCRIGPRARLSAGTIIGDNVTVGAAADLKRPVIWNGAIIGEEVHLRGCTIARGARVGRRAQLLEGSVVGALTTVGDEAVIAPEVRLWPSKKVEVGAHVTMNLIWGTTAIRNLFSQRGVSGLANVEITPEFAVKLGAAYGATLKPGAQVQVSRDQRAISRMISRSLVSGLMSVGVNVQNLEATAIPIARYVAPMLEVNGGIHVRVHPEHNDRTLIEFFDSQGINLGKSREKKIESAFFKEDFRRARIDEIGEITYPSRTLEFYGAGFIDHLSAVALRNSPARVVIDYAYGVSGAVLPTLLGKLGCEAVVLNAALTPNAPPTSKQRESLLTQLGNVVEALQATFGVQIFANGERFTLVDEAGAAIKDEQLTALLVELVLTDSPRSVVVIPTEVSGVVEQIAHRHDGRVVRTKASPTALMEAAAATNNVALAGSAEMGFIFPQLHPGFDAMFAVARLIEMLAEQERSLSQTRQDLPRIHHRHHVIHCPWNAKGAMMRQLVESHPEESLELMDGVKVHFSKEDWVLILPDAGEPLVHIYSNGHNRESVERLARKYREVVQEFTRDRR